MSRRTPNAKVSKSYPYTPGYFVVVVGHALHCTVVGCNHTHFTLSSFSLVGGSGTQRQCLWQHNWPHAVCQAGSEDCGYWYPPTEHALHQGDMLHQCSPTNVHTVQGKQVFTNCDCHFRLEDTGLKNTMWL